MALKDFATGTVLTAPSPATSGTSLVLNSGEGARMPATPFMATAHPDGSFPTLDNAEKILVTNVSTDTLTITRAQGSTTAKSIATTWRISAAIFEEDIAVPPSTTVDNEIVLFSGTDGRTLKRASSTGILKATSGVIGTATAGTDYYNPGGTDVAVADGGTGASTATAGFDALAPTTTRGDLIYRGASNNLRLAKGTSGQFLKQGTNDPAWAGITEADLTLSDITTNDVSTSNHGFVPKAPNNSDHLFLRDDGTWGSTHLTGELKFVPFRIAPTGWLNADGSSVLRSTYATLWGAIAPSLGTFTVTIASPAVVTKTAHGLSTGDSVYLTTTGALPTGLAVDTLYYIVRVDANSFNLASSRANAYAGTKINTSGSQSGTHTVWDCPFGFADSTHFNLPDMRGRVPAGMDTTGGTAANRLKLTQSQGTYGNLGASGGEEGHQITTAELAAHNHTVTDNTWNLTGGTSGSFGNLLMLNNTGNHNISLGTNNSGSDTAHNNVQPTTLGNWIIKT